MAAEVAAEHTHLQPRQLKLSSKERHILSSITILQDGRVATTTITDSLANFKVEIANITTGI